MTQGLTGFRKIQIGKESTPGTPVAATVQLLGALTMKEALALARPNEETGALTKATRSTVAGKQAELKFEGELTFEQFLYLLLMGVKGDVAATPVYPGSAMVFTSPATYTDYTDEVTDDSSATHMPADALGTSDYIYIGRSTKFSRIVVDVGSNPNANASVLSAEYSKGSSVWGSLTITDGTTSGGATLAQDGAITWTNPSDWDTDDVDAETSLYWVRLKVSSALSATVDVDGIELSAAVYTWTFTPSLIAAAAQNAYTIEYGDNVQAYEVEYGMVSSIEVSGAPDEALKVTAEMFGRQMTACTFTTSLSFPTVEPALFNKGKLYIDSAWASIGNTQKSATLVDFTLRIDTGLAPLKAADGTLYFSIVAEKVRGVELDMTIHWNDTVATTERAAWAAQTKRALRLEFEGTTIENSDVKKLTFDLWGAYTDWETIADKDGASVVAVKFASIGDVTNNHEFSVAVVNGASTV
jgi:hypothetical protein